MRPPSGAGRCTGDWRASSKSPSCEPGTWRWDPSPVIRRRFGRSTRQRSRLLEETIAELDSGVLRAHAVSLLGYVRLLDDSFPEAAGLLEKALAEAADDHAVLVPMLVTLSFALFNTGRLGASLQRADDVVTHAESFGRPDLLSQALGMRAFQAPERRRR